MDGYRALLIGNSSFPADPQNLQELKGPVNDVAVLGAALTDRDTGLFDHDHVALLVERPAGKLLEEIEGFLSEARRDDQLVLYCSGHGLLDERNQLYLAAANTRVDRLRSTAVSAADISEMLDGSAARTAVIILDCCYSGAFKGNISPANLAGSGRFVLTSCRSGELANDADRRNGTSLFTQHLVDGLSGGVPDLDGDGRVDVDEVYRYVREQLAATNRQVPQRRFDGSARTPALARRTLPAAADPPPRADTARPAGEAVGAPEEAPGPEPLRKDTGPSRSPDVEDAPGSQRRANGDSGPRRGALAAARERLRTWDGRRRGLAAGAVLAGVVVAGDGTAGFKGDGGDAVKAQIHQPESLAMDKEGKHLSIADCQNNRVRQVDLGTNTISTVAGGGSDFTEGDLATDAALSCPRGLAVGADDALYLTDGGSFVRKVAKQRITTVAGPVGAGAPAFYDDGRAATATTFSGQLRSIAIDGRKGLYLSDGVNRVRFVDPATGIVSTVA